MLYILSTPAVLAAGSQTRLKTLAEFLSATEMLMMLLIPDTQMSKALLKNFCFELNSHDSPNENEL